MTASGRVMTADPRHAVRRLTTGVTVLTVAHRDDLHGTTVSTTSAVSRSPLMVCAGLRRGSLLTRLALDSGWFGVNVLSERQALIADWFANPERPAGGRQFAVIDWVPHPETRVPLLRNSLSQLVCRVHDHLPAGDHDLLVGEVVEGMAGVGGPLVSFDGALHGAEFRDVTRIRGWRDVSTRSTTTLD